MDHVGYGERIATVYRLHSESIFPPLQRPVFTVRHAAGNRPPDTYEVNSA